VPKPRFNNKSIRIHGSCESQKKARLIDSNTSEIDRRWTFEGTWEGGFRNVAWSKLGLELSAKAQATEIKNAQSSTVCGALCDLRCSHGTAQLPGGSRPS
jgi:hypothetical protein